MKILLTNIHSVHNAGDAILLEQSLALLNSNFPDAEITLVLNDPASYTGSRRTIPAFATYFKRYDAQSARWRMARILMLPLWLIGLLVAVMSRKITLLPPTHRQHLHAYRHADFVASVGGNYFYSSGNVGLPFLFIFVQLALAVWLKKPLVLLPQTIGPLRNRRDRALLRWLIDRACVVFLRDAASEQYIGRRRDHVYVVPDLAFAGVNADGVAADAIFAEYGIEPEKAAPLIGITLLNWGAQNPRFLGQAAYERSVVTLIRHVTTHQHAQVLLLSQVQGPTPDQDDRRTAARVFAEVSDLAERVVFVEKGCSAETLQAIYSRLDLLIGTRLHSNIFALTALTPVLAIAYQPKTLGVLKMLQLEEWVLPIETVTGDRLIAQFEALWQQLPTVQAQVRREMGVMLRRLNETGALLQQHLSDCLPDEV
jgi:colanic acid/amylovoran biosynthesis protein